MFSRIVEFDALRSIAFDALSTAYTAIGTPFAHTVRLIKFVNETDSDALVSLDGVTDNDIVPSGGFALYDLTTNGPSQTEFIIAKGTLIYAKQEIASTSGNFYVTCIYGKGE